MLNHTAEQSLITLYAGKRYFRIPGRRGRGAPASAEFVTVYQEIWRLYKSTAD